MHIISLWFCTTTLLSGQCASCQRLPHCVWCSTSSITCHRLTGANYSAHSSPTGDIVQLRVTLQAPLSATYQHAYSVSAHVSRYKELLSQREGSDRFVDAEAQTVEHLQKAKEVQCNTSSTTSTEVQVCDSASCTLVIKSALSHVGILFSITTGPMSHAERHLEALCWNAVVCQMMLQGLCMQYTLHSPTHSPEGSALLRACTLASWDHLAAAQQKFVSVVSAGLHMGHQ